jgi:hypothetical protein
MIRSATGYRQMLSLGANENSLLNFSHKRIESFFGDRISPMPMRIGFGNFWIGREPPTRQKIWLDFDEWDLCCSKKKTCKIGIKTKRKKAGYQRDYLLKVLGFKGEA